MMRCGLLFAVALAVMATTTGAQADDEWCGYAIKDKAVIECGYSTAAECQNAVGNGGMCFIDPDYAINERRSTPATPVKSPAGQG
jgi:Protein of unknown function (DUF3551)